MRILQVYGDKELKKVMHRLGVDPYGIQIMSPKAEDYLVKINSLTCIAANILKQEMLSLGADAALPQVSLTGGHKKTDCILIGNTSELNRLKEKLKRQPFGLNKVAQELSETLKNYGRDEFKIALNGYRLNLTSRCLIMGIVNLTPDSFSGDGLYGKLNLCEIIDYAQRMVGDGADIIDIGGQSSRPGAKPVSVKEEIKRTIPVIKALAKKIKVPISIDTYKPQVAKLALDNGAAIVNDICGATDLKLLKLVSRYNAGLIIMHMKGRPRNMQKNPVYKSLIDEIIAYLSCAIQRAEEYGVDKDKVIIDPGIGFGKTLEQNLEILKKLREFKVLGRPILVGPSRKSFIGKILNLAPQERISGTLSACVLAARNGANMVRVHDVKEVHQALRIAGAIINTNFS
jgi:dihydropteroate synthase